MKLRGLEEKDAPFMLEWMHDEDVVNNMQANFKTLTIDDCLKFIDASRNEQMNLHRAIVDENDEYMGTVSLKRIKNTSAEFAIAIRKCAMSHGYSIYGMKKIIQYGFDVLGLNQIYWCVAPENKRAIRFYDKNGYKRLDLVTEYTDVEGYTQDQINKFIWYQVFKEDIL